MGELDGIDPSLHAAYRLCRTLNARHGKTYFLATRLLPKSRRAGVHALYGFARMVDDVVDVGAESGIAHDGTAAARAGRDRASGSARCWPGGVSGHAERTWSEGAGGHTLRATAFHTSTTTRSCIRCGWTSREPPRFRSRYRTMAELSEYMYGSAAVIGLQMLPILGTSVPIDDAVGPARAREKRSS